MEYASRERVPRLRTDQTWRLVPGHVRLKTAESGSRGVASGRTGVRAIAAMSGCRPLIKGFFGVALIVGAVMSSTFHAENKIRWP